jgi:hypothetical protein
MRPVVSRSILVAAVCAGLWAGAGSAFADSPPCNPADLVCLQVSDSPDPVSVTTPSSATYVAYTATLINQRTANRSHLTLSDPAPAGMTLVSATPSSGVCATSPSGATCALGSLQGGTKATVTFVFTTPSTAGTVSNTLTAHWDENTNDSPGTDPKQDTAVQVETTSVSDTPGFAQTYLPPGLQGQLSTDPTGSNDPTATQTEVLQALIPPQTKALLARLARVAGPFTCPSGQVCRTGDWMQATIPGAPFDPALRFTLHWDATLIQKGQNQNNLVVFYTESLDGTTPVTVVSRRCSSANPTLLEMPCLFGVTKEKDGDYSATLIQNHNGYMR